jgi:hypothetical protein
MIFYVPKILIPTNETEEIFSSNNPKFVLAEQVRRSVIKYYKYRAAIVKKASKSHPPINNLFLKRSDPHSLKQQLKSQNRRTGKLIITL